MRISEFAKKYGLSTSAVRYYINQGLLVPGKKKDQYDFGKECGDDIKKLLRYKECRFSLDQIRELFFLEKASRLRDEGSAKAWTDIMNQKKKELLAEQEDIGRCLQLLEEDLESMFSDCKSDSVEQGIPFAFLSYLYCPDCGKTLRLDSASLSAGYVYDGELLCECGYHALISGGMIQCEESVEDSPLKAFENVDSVISMMDEFSPSYRALLEKTYLWLYNQVGGRADAPQTVMAGPFSFNFMLKYLDRLDPDSIYIFVDPSRKRIRKMQQYFQSRNCYNLVFIAGTPSRIPVKKHSVDIYIDDYSTVNSLFVYNDFGTGALAALLKYTGRVFGVFTKYHKAPKMLHSFKQMHPDFNPEKMTMSGLKYSWSANGMHITEEKTIGETITDDEPHPHNVVGETLEVCGYMASAGKSGKR